MTDYPPLVFPPPDTSRATLEAIIKGIEDNPGSPAVYNDAQLRAMTMGDLDRINAARYAARRTPGPGAADGPDDAGT